MSYIKFDTQEQASLGANVILRLASGPLEREGYTIDPETGFVASGVKSSTGEHIPVVTLPDTPIQAADGKWYINSPSYDRYYNTDLVGNLRVIAERFGLSTAGIVDVVEFRTGREWLVAMWPLLGLGIYDDNYDPEFTEVF